jgi:hypothetical protein
MKPSVRYVVLYICIEHSLSIRNKSKHKSIYLSLFNNYIYMSLSILGNKRTPGPNQ